MYFLWIGLIFNKTGAQNTALDCLFFMLGGGGGWGVLHYLPCRLGLKVIYVNILNLSNKSMSVWEEASKRIKFFWKVYIYLAKFQFYFHSFTRIRRWGLKTWAEFLIHTSLVKLLKEVEWIFFLSISLKGKFTNFNESR